MGQSCKFFVKKYFIVAICRQSNTFPPLIDIEEQDDKGNGFNPRERAPRKHARP